MRLLRSFRSVHGISLSILLGAAAPGAGAQPGSLDAPAHIEYVDGDVLLEREGQSQPASFGLPFLAGDRLRSAVGRIEILFPDGSALHVDDNSSVELLSDTLLRMTSGRILLIVAGANDPANALRFQIDTPAASVVTDGPGDYRVSVFPDSFNPSVELAVIRGWATFWTDVGSVRVLAGTRSLAGDGAAPSLPRAFNSARFDDFDTWSLARRGARMGRTASADYLPSDLRMYGGTLDQHGTWQYESPVGYVWYPAVSPDWRPYYYGSWASYPSLGWTWIGADVWAWPTHHYGRWGYARSRWYWAPGRTWSPAWVHWGAASDFVGWCPVGFDNQPAFGMAVTAGDPRWVVVPRRAFGSANVRVHEQAVARQGLPPDTPLVVRSAAPTFPRPGAVPVVDVEPVRRVAVPRVAASTAVGAGAPAGARVIRMPPPAASPTAPVTSRRTRSGAPVEQAATPPVESVTPGVGGGAVGARAVPRDAAATRGPVPGGRSRPEQAAAPMPTRQAAPRAAPPAAQKSAPAAAPPSARQAARGRVPAARESAPAAAPSRAGRPASAPAPEAAPAPSGGAQMVRPR